MMTFTSSKLLQFVVAVAALVGPVSQGPDVSDTLSDGVGDKIAFADFANVTQSFSDTTVTDVNAVDWQANGSVPLSERLGAGIAALCEKMHSVEVGAELTLAVILLAGGYLAGTQVSLFCSLGIISGAMLMLLSWILESPLLGGVGLFGLSCARIAKLWIEFKHESNELRTRALARIRMVRGWVQNLYFRSLAEIVRCLATAWIVLLRTTQNSVARIAAWFSRK